MTAFAMKRPASKSIRNVLRVEPLRVTLNIPALPATAWEHVLECLPPWLMFRISSVSSLLRSVALEMVRGTIVFTLVAYCDAAYKIRLSRRKTSILDPTSAICLHNSFGKIEGMYAAIPDTYSDYVPVSERLMARLACVVAKMRRLEVIELFFGECTNAAGGCTNSLLPTSLLQAATRLPTLTHITYDGLSASPRTSMALVGIIGQLQVLHISSVGSFPHARQGLADAVWGMLVGSLAACRFGQLRVLSIRIDVCVDAEGRDLRVRDRASSCVSFVDALGDALWYGHGLKTLLLRSAFRGEYDDALIAFNALSSWRSGAIARLHRRVVRCGGCIDNGITEDVVRRNAYKWYNKDGEVSYSFSWQHRWSL